jgi:hypothetical protein
MVTDDSVLGPAIRKYLSQGIHIMKIVKIFLSSVAMYLGISSAPASACSYFINTLAVGNELGAQGLTHLGVSLGEVRSAKVTDLRYWESISTPMCPEEMTYEITLDVEWLRSEPQDPEGPVTTTPKLKQCQTRLKVTKREPWGSDLQPEFSFESQTDMLCSYVPGL